MAFFDLPFWMGTGTALLCGGILGLERQLRGKPAGIRTCILICLGTSIFIRLGATQIVPQADPTRVLAQVVTGIGFLGAGVIIAREGSVLGVTSAAVIWILAGMGALIGFGRYLEALVITGVAVGVLRGVEMLEGNFRRLRQGFHSRAGERDDRSQD